MSDCNRDEATALLALMARGTWSGETATRLEERLRRREFQGVRKDWDLNNQKGATREQLRAGIVQRGK